MEEAECLEEGVEVGECLAEEEEEEKGTTKDTMKEADVGNLIATFPSVNFSPPAVFYSWHVCGMARQTARLLYSGFALEEKG